VYHMCEIGRHDECVGSHAHGESAEAGCSCSCHIRKRKDVDLRIAEHLKKNHKGHVRSPRNRHLTIKST
jgi:hypothetical protein